MPLDPNAELAVGDGEVRVTIPRFSLHECALGAGSVYEGSIGSRDEAARGHEPRSASTLAL
jgi:hypothetical protein